MAPTAKTRTSVFISYSHCDRRHLEQLKMHLTPLQRERGIEIWADTEIRAGDDWRARIREALDSAKVAIILVSAPFRASEFIARNELPPLLAAAQNEGLVIIPVVVGACNFVASELGGKQSINLPSKPVDGLRRADRDKVWATVAQRVEEVMALDTVHDIEQVEVQPTHGDAPADAHRLESDYPARVTPPVSKMKGAELRDYWMAGDASSAQQANRDGRFASATELARARAKANPSSFPLWFEYAYALAKLGSEEVMSAVLHAWDCRTTISPQTQLDKAIAPHATCAFVAAAGPLPSDLRVPVMQASTLLLTEQGGGELIRLWDERLLPYLQIGMPDVINHAALRLLASPIDVPDQRWILFCIYGV